MVSPAVGRYSNSVTNHHTLDHQSVDSKYSVLLPPVHSLLPQTVPYGAKPKTKNIVDHSVEEAKKRLVRASRFCANRNHKSPAPEVPMCRDRLLRGPYSVYRACGLGGHRDSPSSGWPVRYLYGSIRSGQHGQNFEKNKVEHGITVVDEPITCIYCSGVSFRTRLLGEDKEATLVCRHLRTECTVPISMASSYPSHPHIRSSRTRLDTFPGAPSAAPSASSGRGSAPHRHPRTWPESAASSRPRPPGTP